MEIKIFNQKGEESGKIKVSKKVFGLDFNADLVHDVMVAQMANRRKTIAHTKERGDVRGGGKKPWAQKGTGRARHGSIRSPIWRTGGVTFGPRKEKSYKQKINKKVKIKALFMVLGSKLKDNEIFIVDKIDLKEAKTKHMSGFLNNLGILGKTLILSLEKNVDNSTILLASRNIARVKLLPTEDLNVLDLLSAKYLILTKSGIAKLEKIYLDKKNN